MLPSRRERGGIPAQTAAQNSSRRRTVSLFGRAPRAAAPRRRAGGTHPPLTTREWDGGSWAMPSVVGARQNDREEFTARRRRHGVKAFRGAP